MLFAFRYKLKLKVDVILLLNFHCAMKNRFIKVVVQVKLTAGNNTTINDLYWGSKKIF